MKLIWKLRRWWMRRQIGRKQQQQHERIKNDERLDVGQGFLRYFFFKWRWFKFLIFTLRKESVILPLPYWFLRTKSKNGNIILNKDPDVYGHVLRRRYISPADSLFRWKYFLFNSGIRRHVSSSSHLTENKKFPVFHFFYSTSLPLFQRVMEAGGGRRIIFTCV